MTHTVSLTFNHAAPAVELSGNADAPRRTLTGPAMPFNVPSSPTDLDGLRYIFTGPPRNVSDLIDVVDEHDDRALCGRLAEPLTVTPDGLTASARIFATTRGNDLLVEAAEGAKTGFSFGAAFDAYTEGANGIRTVTDWTAVHLGVVRHPAFAEATGLVAASARKEPTAMSDPTPDPQPVTPTVVELPTVAELAAQVLPILRDTIANETGQGDKPSVLAEFSCAAQAVHAMVHAKSTNPERFDELRAAFAAVNQITSNNPGVMGLPPWARALKANLDTRRPLIEGTGGTIPLPDAGMTSIWPRYTGNLDALIAQQVNEKDELASVRIDITNASSPLLTAGMYSDIAYQLLLRSSPSYLAIYDMILEAAWYRYTEAKYEAGLVAGGTAIVPTSAVTFAGMTGVLLRALIWEASTAVEDATGKPATIVGVSSDIWKKIGTLTDLPNGKDGVVMNQPGTADASTLTVQIGGLTVKRAPFLAAKTVVATNDVAAKFAETGAMWASQEDVTKLGRDVAVWGMYNPAEIYFPAGVVKYVMA